MRRRDFLSSSLAAVAVGLAARSARAADSSVEVLVNEPLGTIAPEMQGHFTEHIGSVVYNGIWVGEDSPIPNVGGVRKALVEHMRRLRAPVIRWPGGCFADSYNWRDGIGSRSKRPVRTNFWDNDAQLAHAPAGPQKYDPNTFGTAEFMRFCQLCGAQPYLAANVRSLTPHDFDEWVEYCNSPAGSTTLASTRAQDGSREPFNVTYWGIGNESWGCGGDLRPEEYAVEFRRFTSWVPDYGRALRFIASGPGTSPSDPQVSWTRGFLANLVGTRPDLLDRLYGLSLHYYCGTTGKGNSLQFSTDEWYQMLGQADAMDTLITQHWQAMGEFDRRRQAKLVVDEWGVWHSGTPLGPAYLFSFVPSLRDALVSALTLDIFNRHPEKLAMCNDAQLVNNLNTLFLAMHDRFVPTTIFHVFDMYKSHQGGQAVRMICEASSIPYHVESSAPAGAMETTPVQQTRQFWGLAGSASRQGNTLIVTVVNPHVSDASTAEVRLRGGAAKSVRATVLTAPDIHASNYFDRPDTVVPRDRPTNVSGARFPWTFPAASVTKLEIAL